MRVVKAFAREDLQRERFEHERLARLRAVDDLDAAARVLHAVHRASCRSSASRLLLFLGGRAVIDGRLGLGEFTAFYVYMLALIGPMRAIGWILGAVAARDGVRPADLRAARPRAARSSRRPTPAPLPAGHAAASSCAARRSPTRRAREPALRRRHADVEAGTTIALVGADRLGQDDARRADLAPVRRDRRRGARRRRRRARRRPALAAPRDRRRHRRPVPLQRDRARQHRLRAARRGARARRSSRPPSARRRTASSRRCPTATTRASASAA